MSEDDPVSITEFLLARITEDEAAAKAALGASAHSEQSPVDGHRAWIASDSGERLFEFDRKRLLEADRETIALAEHLTGWLPARVLAECEAKRRIIEMHQSWPVLVESPPTIEDAGDLTSGDLNSLTLRMSQTMAWLTEQEYRSKFGSEPPTAPMLRALAAVYADHPDYDETWTT